MGPTSHPENRTRWVRYTEGYKRMTEHTAEHFERPEDLPPAVAREALGPWFHNLHLKDGSQTAPGHPYGDFPRFKWNQIAAVLPEDLTGWTALDIGCNAGYYSFELARRGARVTAIDSNPHYLRQARWATQHFQLSDRIQFAQMQIYELARMPNAFDLVLFMGVFYHLRYPLLALDVVTQKVHRTMVFQTLTMPGDAVYEPPRDLPFEQRQELIRLDWPHMAFIEHRMAKDPTNWWVPNHAAVEALLRSTGMRIIGYPGHEIYLCEPDPHAQLETREWNLDELRAATGMERMNK